MFCLLLINKTFLLTKLLLLKPVSELIALLKMHLPKKKKKNLPVNSIKIVKLYLLIVLIYLENKG